MRKIMYVVVAILLVVGLIAGGVIVLGSEYWETPWNEDTVSGSWGQEILVEYTDGSTDSLKIGSDSILSTYHNDREIQGIYYVLSAKAEGTGYDTILYDFTDFVFTYEASGSNIKNIHQVPCTNYNPSGKPVDGQWYELIKHYTDVTDIIPDTSPVGDYIVTVSPSGNIKYSADGETQVVVTDLPDTISFTLKVEENKSISVSFSSGYEVT